MAKKIKEENSKSYEITDKIKEVGYFGKIDGGKFIIIPRQYGETFNKETGVKGTGLVKEAILMQDDNELEGTAFLDLTETQTYQLVLAGVIKNVVEK